MGFFPVADSLLSAEHIGLFVQDRYHLHGSVTARIIKKGISDTYLISVDAEKYIFRVYSLNWRTKEEIAEEITLLNLLKENGIPVSYPIADAQSMYTQQLAAPEGNRFAVLFSFAKGGKMLNFPATLHYKAGEIMARMHAVTHNLSLQRVHYTPEILLISSFEQLKQFLPADTEEMLFMQSTQHYLHELFSADEMSQLRKGIVHLDMWFDNMSIDKEQITLFDFDFCGNAWLFLDIAYYVLQIFSTEQDKEEYAIKKDSFLKGYGSVTAISQQDLDLLPAGGASLYFFYLGVQCSRYDNWSNNFLNEIYLKRFINLLVKKWMVFNKMQLPMTEC